MKMDIWLKRYTKSTLRSVRTLENDRSCSKKRMNIVATGGPVERNSCDFPNFCGLPLGCYQGQKAEEPVLCLISLGGD